jgi:hypothetical protein
MYDAVNAVDRTHQPFFARTAAPRGASAAAAAAIAAHRSLTELYPNQQAGFDDALDRSLNSIPDGPAKADGVDLGQNVAEKTLEWRSRDMQEARSSYRPSYLLGRWQPTLPDYRSPLLPGWAYIKPFAIRNAAEMRPPAPPALTSEAFAASFAEVKALGGANSQARTREQTQIARFWEDDLGTVTPPGHWNHIAQTVALERRNTLAENARLFAMLNVALADAAIVCWDSKFHYDFYRPVTAIRQADQLREAALLADPNWAPLLKTPPFPAYTSGHSTFSAAGAAALAQFFGTDNVRFSTTSDGLPGATRSFSRLSDAASEAGMSRIYGGNHWDFDNRQGLACGKKVGDFVGKHFFQPTLTPTGANQPAPTAQLGVPEIER